MLIRSRRMSDHVARPSRSDEVAVRASSPVAAGPLAVCVRDDQTERDQLIVCVCERNPVLDGLRGWRWIETPMTSTDSPNTNSARAADLRAHWPPCELAGRVQSELDSLASSRGGRLIALRTGSAPARL